MPRPRRDIEYFGCEFPVEHIELLRSLAAKEDRSVGSLLRIIVGEWIEKHSRGAGSTGTGRSPVPPAAPAAEPAGEEEQPQAKPATDERAHPLQNKLRRSLLRNLVAVRIALAERVDRAAQLDLIEEPSLTPAPALETVKRGGGRKS